MPTCEMCGYIGEVKPAVVEGSMLHLCKNCLRFGEAVEIKHPPKDVVDQRLTFKRSSWKERFSSKKRSAESDNIVPKYAYILRRARNSMGKTQEEIAQAIAEKASVIQKVESGAMEPPLKLAKKLEQFFKVKLIIKEEKISKDVVGDYSFKSSDVTIGDLIKLKKKS